MNYKNLRSAYDLNKLKRLNIDSVKKFAEVIRADMIDIVSKTGGHIGVNLGTLEITLALHYVYNFPRDNLVFDTGHNCYTHKMLTGRLKKMKTMRHHGGLSGFPNPKESKYDLISWSHGGTGLSVGLGLAVSEKLTASKRATIVIVGDASLVEGVSQEALNHVGREKDLRLLIVLNDNGIAIDPWDGGLYRYLSRLKRGAKETYFSSLGIDYVGPIDGHNLEKLVNVFSSSKKIKKPIVVHCVTRKGNKLPWRQNDPNQNHWLFPYNKEDGSIIGEGKEYWHKPSEPFLNMVAANSIYEIVKKDKDAIVISPATNGISGITKIFEDFPQQTIDVAMAEQHAVAFSVGLSLRGKKKPILCFQSAFLPRAFDQLIQELSLNKTPVLLVITRSGVAGLDHEVHHAIFDISYLTPLPNLKILYPASVKELKNTINKSYLNLKEPTVILYAYGLLSDLDISKKEIKRSKQLEKNARIAILTTGNTNKYGYGLQEYINQKLSIGSKVINITQLSPIKSNELKRLCDKYPFLLTLEENVLRGGLGSIIAEFIIDNAFENKLIRIGFPNCFVEKGLRSYLYPKYNMDYESILKRIKKSWGMYFN